MLAFSDMLALSTPAHSIDVGDPALQLFEVQGTRWLCSSDSAIQTAICLAHPSALLLPSHRAMALGALIPARLRRILDLGTGGGALLRHFEALGDRPALTTVEQNPQMLALARRWFSLAHAQEVVMGDAVAYLTRSQDSFDLVSCDVFENRKVPDALHDQPFFAQLARVLAPGGAAVLNLLPESDNCLRAVLDAAAQSFAEPALYPVPELGNVVLFLSKVPFPGDEQLLARLTQTAGARRADEHEALVAVIRGLHRLRARNR